MHWNCPECGHVNDEEIIRCVCGYEINEAGTEESQASFDVSAKRMPQIPTPDFDEPNKEHRPFLRRFSAFIIDLTILGILGQVLSIGLTSRLILLGDKGPFIGLLILLLYFGLGNSKAFNGQTVGKFAMKVTVSRLDGNKLTIPLSILRSSIYVVPYIFNGWALDLGQSSFANFFWIIIGSWLFSYIISLFIFTIGNWRSGRLLQDIIFRTRVDRIDNDTIPATKKEMVLFAVCMCLFAGFLAFNTISNYADEPESLKPVASFYKVMLKEYPDFRFGLNLNHVTGEDNVKILTIRALPRMNLNAADTDHYTDVFALKALNEFQEIADVDFMCIGIVNGFDIGIARRSFTSWERWSVGKWRNKLGANGDLEQGENKKIPFIPALMR